MDKIHVIATVAFDDGLYVASDVLHRDGSIRSTSFTIKVGDTIDRNTIMLLQNLFERVTALERGVQP